MRYFEFPTKDATIYQGALSSSQNTGLDEILEVNKTMNDVGSVTNVSRILIKFDIAYTSILSRAIDTLEIILKEIDQENLMVFHDWRLNERHYGALQGLN